MTEGFLTIEHLLEYCEEWMEDRLSFNRLKRKKDAAALLGVMLFEQATDINFYFGGAINKSNVELGDHFRNVFVYHFLRPPLFFCIYNMQISGATKKQHDSTRLNRHAAFLFIFFSAGYPIRRRNNILCFVVGWGGMRGFVFLLFPPFN